MGDDKPTKKPQVSTIHVKDVSEDDTESDTVPESFDVEAETPSRPLSSAEDTAQRMVVENDAAQSSEANTEQKKTNKPPAVIQFRFGDVAFFISQVELDRLNAKYAEYIDSGEMLKHSFADYLLEGVEEHD